MSTYPWFRFYVEALYDRKLRRLKPEHRWLFVACLGAARQSPKPGVLRVGDSFMTEEDLCDVSALARNQVHAGVAALVAAGLLQVDEGGGWFVPQWGERQFESDSSGAERTRQWRDRKRRSDVTVTPQDTETEPDNPLSPPSAVEQCPDCDHHGFVLNGKGEADRCMHFALLEMPRPPLALVDSGEAK